MGLLVNCDLRKWDNMVSCHLCHAQVDVIKTRLVYADKHGRIPPADKERIWRQQGIKPFMYVRLCLECAKKEGR